MYARTDIIRIPSLANAHLPLIIQHVERRPLIVFVVSDSNANPLRMVFAPRRILPPCPSSSLLRSFSIKAAFLQFGSVAIIGRNVRCNGF